VRDFLLGTEAKLRESPRAKTTEMADGEDAAAARRRAAVADYRKKMLNCRELESRVGTGESCSTLSAPIPLRSSFPRVRG
jgi:hypothetical protein